MIIARVVRNDNNYTSINGLAEYGANTPNGVIFGFEEWNNAQFIQKEKVAYLNCYKSPRLNQEVVFLIARANPLGPIALYRPVGKLINVKQLNNAAIPGLNTLITANLPAIQLNFVPFDPTVIAGNPAHSYWQHLNSLTIIGPMNNHFLLNLEYEEFQEAPHYSEIEIQKFTKALRQVFPNNNWYLGGASDYIKGNWEKYF